PVPGVLVETDVTDGKATGGIECALTYTSIFTGRSAVREHGLMKGLGLKDSLFEKMVLESNLFSRFSKPCLANALFPAHLPFLRGSYVEDLLPACSREEVEAGLLFRRTPVRLSGREKHGFAELFTLAEINQNIFIFAARQAGAPLLRYRDVREGRALTSSMTHELENEFSLSFFGEAELPTRSPEEAAAVLVGLLESHDFVFYKYQMADLISHTGRLVLARAVFHTIERFARAVLQSIGQGTTVVLTSDHGHLEQVSYHKGHPKTKVPTWCFGEAAVAKAETLSRPEGIFHLLTSYL
ncbi:MAG: hypothetical protein ACRD4T_14875, partial [Candidatus Acidiferrales bacterium]